MKVIFVSGAYRAENQLGVERNIRYAESAAIDLWKQGWAVYCPHKNTAHFDGILPDEVWLEANLEILKRCDAIYMLKGWQKSTGAIAEYQLADTLGLGVYYESLAPANIGTLKDR